jgi:hypothetical protein
MQSVGNLMTDNPHYSRIAFIDKVFGKNQTEFVGITQSQSSCKPRIDFVNPSQTKQAMLPHFHADQTQKVLFGHAASVADCGDKSSLFFGFFLCWLGFSIRSVRWFARFCLAVSADGASKSSLAVVIVKAHTRPIALVLEGMGASAFDDRCVHDRIMVRSSSESATKSASTMIFDKLIARSIADWLAMSIRFQHFFIDFVLSFLVYGRHASDNHLPEGNHLQLQYPLHFGKRTDIARNKRFFGIARGCAVPAYPAFTTRVANKADCRWRLAYPAF